MNSSNSARLQRCENQLRGFLDEAVRGVPVEVILQPPESGKWSANEHLAHLARHHQIFLERIDCILKEQRSAFSRYRAEETKESPATANPARPSSHGSTQRNSG